MAELESKLQRGRRMPAEWERHEATWLQWPCAEGASFPGVWTTRVEPQFVQLIEWIAEVESVRVAVSSEKEGDRVRKMLSPIASGRTEFHPIPTREPWCRDIGPTYVLDSAAGGGRRAVKWRFNGWGEQYFHPHDEAAGNLIAEADGIDVEKAGIVFEGGGVDSDGAGSLLVTTECLLDPMRNPDLSKADAEAILLNCLGAEKVIWLRGGVSGDDTGHTDVVARFVGSGRIAVPMPGDRQHADYLLLEENSAHLRGLGCDVVHFPVLDLEYNDVIKDYIPKSYVNFYVMNEILILPQFDVSEDAEALSLARDLFPDRQIYPFDSRDIAFGQGGVHCLTQQVPALPAEDVGEDEWRDDGGV